MADEQEAQGSLLREHQKKDKGPVRCLGLPFESDDARRNFFLEKLREKLGDPEFRKIEGFPLGSDEDILALSDPPFYTACPNPFIGDFLKTHGRTDTSVGSHQIKAYSADVSEGKNDPVYNLHSYHTKVPPRAIMRYLLHYTDPGDVVFDGFCGTGMTALAAQLCGDRSAVGALGYSIGTDGLIRDEDGNPLTHVGVRHGVISDLSPFATTVAAGYLKLGEQHDFVEEANAIVAKVEKDLQALYMPSDGGPGKIESTIWSDVFICPHCNGEIVYWEAAVKDGQIQDSFHCPHCDAVLGKAASKELGATKMKRAFVTEFDPVLRESVVLPKWIPVVENIKLSKGKRQLEIGKIRAHSLSAGNMLLPWIPLDEFFPGRQTNKLINGTGIRHVLHMYTRRALIAYATLHMQRLGNDTLTALFRFSLTAINNYISRKQGYFGGGGGVAGTLFTPSIHLERNVFNVLRRKLKGIRNADVNLSDAPSVAISTSSATDLRVIPGSSVDYIFTDPPFGESLQYAELNHFVEAWLRVRTASPQDCVLNYVHKKDLDFYARVMNRSFAEFARILKPGKWITVEFHNSQNAVWAAIQRSLESAGLVVADVRLLDKQQRSFNAVNRAGAVDKDLIISAYKPNGGLEQRFELEAGSEEGVWDFVRTHLAKLPIFAGKSAQARVITERQRVLLFDRMVAFHVQHGVSVPLSAGDFYQGLANRFPEREDMYFLPEQVSEYERKRMAAGEMVQLDLFVSDEASAIQWLKQHLTAKPQTFQEIQPQFMRETQGGWQKHEKLLELSLLLEENFLRFDGTDDVPSQIHGYLSSNFKDLRGLEKSDAILRAKAKDRWYVPDAAKAGDLEKLRERSLLREFDSYRDAKERKLKVFRVEAMRAGFRRAWQQNDYEAILRVAEKMPETVLQEDPMLLMWYTNSATRAGRQS